LKRSLATQLASKTRHRAYALLRHTTGFDNAATVKRRSLATQPASTMRPTVFNALYYNTTGSYNTANGAAALLEQHNWHLQHRQRF